MTNNIRSAWGLQNWLTYLESIQPVKFNLRLENVSEVASRMDVLNLAIPVITVGGTNGKGSTVAALTSLYCAGGYNVGHFTSPHLIKFNERICINNKQISDGDAADIMLEIDNLRGDIEISYFEASLLCALRYFKKHKLDLIVLEVGMGGRLDATNIIDADLTIITSIELDHQKYLGNDRLAIGFEKAGIMRGGKSCIFADDSCPITIEKHANELGCDLVRLHENYTFKSVNGDFVIHHAGFADLILPMPKINPKAAASAIIATNLLQDILPISLQGLHNGICNINILGRQQIIYHNNLKIVLDVAHNPHAVSSLIDFIKNMQINGKIHAIFGGLSDKDLLGMVIPLLNIVDNWYPTMLQGRRAATSELLQNTFNQALQLDSCHCYKNFDAAYTAVTNNYVDGDLVIIYGSFVLVGESMQKFTREINYVRAC